MISKMNNYLNSSNLGNSMRKIGFVMLFTFLFMFSFVSAESIGQRQDADVDEPYIISQPCATCTYVNISVFNKNGVVLDNVAMTNKGSTWTYTFTPNESIRHDVNGFGDMNGLDSSFAFYFNVSPLNVTATIFMLIFFVACIVGIAALHQRINLEKWHDKLLNSDKTFIKSSIASVPYTLMKNVFVLYFLIGFPIIFLVTDLITYFNISSIAYIFEIAARIYTVGMVLPGLIILSDGIKMVRDLYDNIQNKNWGLN